MPTGHQGASKAHPTPSKPSSGSAPGHSFRSRPTGTLPLLSQGGARAPSERRRDLRSRSRSGGPGKADDTGGGVKLPSLVKDEAGDKEAQGGGAASDIAEGGALKLPAIGEEAEREQEEDESRSHASVDLEEEEEEEEEEAHASEKDEDEDLDSADGDEDDLEEEEAEESSHEVRGVNKQGALGDCWLISTINAFALHAPEVITRRLVLEADGQTISHIRLNYIDDKGKAEGVYDIPVSVKEIPSKLRKGERILKYANAGKGKVGINEKDLIAPLLELATAKLRMPDKGNTPLDTKAKKDLGYQRLVASPGRKDNHTSSAFAMLAPPGSKVVEAPLGAKTNVETLGPLLKEAGENGYPAVLQTSKYSVAPNQTLDYKRTTGASGLSVSQAQHAITVTSISPSGTLSFKDQGNQKTGEFKGAESFKKPAQSSKNSPTIVKVTQALLDACAPSDKDPQEVTVDLDMGGQAVTVTLSAEKLAEARKTYDARQDKKKETHAAFLTATRNARGRGAGPKEREAKEAAKLTSDKAAKRAGLDIGVKVWIPVVYSPELLTLCNLTREQGAEAELGEPGDLKALAAPKPKPAPEAKPQVTVRRQAHPPANAKPSGAGSGGRGARAIRAARAASTQRTTKP